MPLLDLFASGYQQKNYAHFAALVRIAKADETLTDTEHALLKRVAVRLGIDNAMFKTILREAHQFKINTAVSENERYAHLFDLIQMVIADATADAAEKKLTRRIAIGMGFTENKVEKLVNRALEVVPKCKNTAAFIDKIKAAD